MHDGQRKTLSCGRRASYLATVGLGIALLAVVTASGSAAPAATVPVAIAPAIAPLTVTSPAITAPGLPDREAMTGGASGGRLATVPARAVALATSAPMAPTLVAAVPATAANPASGAAAPGPAPDAVGTAAAHSTPATGSAGPAPAALAAGPAGSAPPNAGRAAVTVPGFWDPKRRPEKPDVTRIPSQIRFVTTEDFPPFNFRGEDGQPAGFNIDLARALCTELAITCTLEVMSFEALTEALAGGKADAAIAGIAITPATREAVDFSDRYFRSPARFVARTADAGLAVSPDALAARSAGSSGQGSGQSSAQSYGTASGPSTGGEEAARRVGVVAGTAHEAYLRDFFAELAIRSYPTAEAARAALRGKEVDLLFGDGVQLAFWLNGSSSEGCCVFVGGPFTESRYFGEGMGIAVRRGNDALRQTLNYALSQLWEKGVYVDLYLRWFPISVY